MAQYYNGQRIRGEDGYGGQVSNENTPISMLDKAWPRILTRVHENRRYDGYGGQVSNEHTPISMLDKAWPRNLTRVHENRRYDGYGGQVSNENTPILMLNKAWPRILTRVHENRRYDDEDDDDDDDVDGVHYPKPKHGHGRISYDYDKEKKKSTNGYGAGNYPPLHSIYDQTYATAKLPEDDYIYGSHSHDAPAYTKPTTDASYDIISYRPASSNYTVLPIKTRPDRRDAARCSGENDRISAVAEWTPFASWPRKGHQGKPEVIDTTEAQRRYGNAPRSMYGAAIDSKTAAFL